MAGLSHKQRAFVEYYLATFNATEAARRAGYSERTARSIGSENLTKPDIAAAIAERVAELTMSPKEVLIRLTEQARFDVGDILTVTVDAPKQATAAKKPDGELGGKGKDGYDTPPKPDEDSGRADAGPNEDDADEDGAGDADDASDGGDVCAQTPVYVRMGVDLVKAKMLGKTRFIKRLKPTKWGVDIQFHDSQMALKLIGQAQGMFKDTLEVSGKDGGPIETAQVHIYIPDNGRGDGN